MVKVLDTRSSEEDRKERDTQDEAYEMLSFIGACDAPSKPGAWVKKWGNHFKHLKDFKSKHFQNVRHVFGDYDRDSKEKEKYKNIPYGK